jgi:predicted nucleic acid-binding Zn ribbon protein
MAASGRDRRGSGRDRRDSGRSDEMKPVGGVLREAMGSERFRRGLALGRLARSWDEVVGPRLARETEPLSLEEGGLVVSVSSGAWGAQVRFLAHEICRRANEVLGTEAVSAVRVTVGRSGRRGGADYGG